MMDRIPRTTRHRWRKTHNALTDADFEWVTNRCIETETVVGRTVLDGFGRRSEVERNGGRPHC